MKFIFLLGITLSLSTVSHCQSYYISAGVDLRTYPIDIESVPPGPAHGDASFYSSKFWKPLSVRASIGKSLANNWAVQFSSVMRYNHTHWKNGLNFNLPPPTKRSESKSFKFDVLLDFERGLNIFHSTNYNFRVQLGIGMINLNSKFDIEIRDTLPSGLSEVRHYKGNFAKLSPHIGLGYKMGRSKIILDLFLVEGPTFQDLSSIWMGTHIVYELWRK